MRTGPLLLVLTLVSWGFSQTQNRNVARLVRTYNGDAAEFVDLSRDGHLLLARGGQTIKCADGKTGCRSEKLAVYDTSTGKRVAELATSGQGWFWYSAAGFVDGHAVAMVQAGPGKERTWIDWDPIKGTRNQFSLPSDILKSDFPIGKPGTH